MKEEKIPFLSKISDNVKIIICRWWFAGAIYFFIGWGSSLGTKIDSLDLMFALGVVIGVCNILILHPLLYSMFDFERKGKLQNKKYFERTIMQGSMLKIAEIFKCLLCSLCVLIVYQYLNIFLNNIFNKGPENVFIPGEPILYGVFFTMFYLLITNLCYFIADLFTKGEVKDA